MKAEIEVIYANQSMKERWEHDPSSFCPDCGQGHVWTEEGPGDYYLGPSSVCLACESGFTVQPGEKQADRVTKIRFTLGLGPVVRG